MPTTNRDATSLRIDVDPSLGATGAPPPAAGGPSSARRPWWPVALVATLVILAGAVAAILASGVLAGRPAPARPSVAERRDTALARLEPSLGRLDRALDGATPARRASMVLLSASADRAGSALGDANRDLRLLEIDAGAREAGSLADDREALTELRDLTDALAAPRLSVAEVELATVRARQAVDDAALELPRLRTAALVAAVRRDRRPATSGGVGADGVSTPVGSAPAAAASAALPASFFTYTGPAFEAQLPQGAGWGTPAQSEPTPGELFRTSVRGPDGLFVIVDYTPLEAARFGGGYDSAETVGQTAFGTGTRYVFSGGRIPECQRSTCVDYILNDAATGAGFGVLAGGGDPAAAAELARTVAESVVPLGD